MEACFIIIFPDNPTEILSSAALVRCLKNQVEEASVYALVQERHHWLLSLNPHIVDILVYQEKPEEQLDKVRELMPDYIIDLDGTRKMRRLKSRLKILDFPVSLRERHGSFPVRAFETCRLFDVQDDGQGPEFMVSPLDPQLLPSEYLEGYFFLSLESSRKGGRPMSDDQIIDFAVMTERPIVVTGEVVDRHLANRIGQSTGCAVFPTCGDLSRMQIASLLDSAQGALVFDPLWDQLAYVLDTERRFISGDNRPYDMKEYALWARSLFNTQL